MTRPKLFDYDHVAFAEARQTTFGRDLVELLAWHVHASCAESDAFAFRGCPHDAAVASGRTSAFRELLQTMNTMPPPADIKPADDDREVDPNMPARARRK